MARDTFVYLKRDKMPRREDLALVLEDYLAGLAVSVVWDKDRFFVELPGSYSYPFARFGDVPEVYREAARELAKESDGASRPRAFEVWIGKDCVDVMTRMADDVTNAIAYGFAEIVARYWGGRIER